MEGSVKNLWEVRAGSMRATLNRDGRRWCVKVTSGGEVLTEQTYPDISLAQQAFNDAANAVGKKKK